MKKMYNYDSKNKFNQFELSSHYLRVDENHPLELFIGLNDKGQKTLRLIGNFIRHQVKGTKSIDIMHFKYGEKYAVNFSLIDKQYEDLFYIFCNDLIDSSRICNIDNGYIFMVNRYEKWKGFSNSIRKYLSEIEIKGLIGELIFLKDVLFEKYGISKSISGWTGTEPTKKDFSYENVWYEVKTSSKDMVHISSIDQLESDQIGYLIVYNLEKLSPEADDIKINKIVNDILLMLDNVLDISQFMIKLADIGYFKEEYYDSYVYRIANTSYYEVNNEFPKINKNSIPSAITNLKYEIIISMLEAYRREKI